MHLLSHTLIAIALSLLDLESINTSTYALPITDLATELQSPATNLTGLRSDSSKLLGREIHNADYSSGGQPQNTTYGTAPSTSSNMSGASPAPDSSSSVPRKSSKTEPAKGKQAMRKLHTKENAVEGVRDDLMAKAGHGRHSDDVASREISTPKDSKDLAPLRPRTLVGRARSMAIANPFGHTHENNGCGSYDYYPYMHMRYAYKARYDTPRHGHMEDDLIGQDALLYKEPLSDDLLYARRRSPTDDAFYAEGVGSEERADVSGDGGPRFRDIRHFDPNDVDRMVAAFLLSHGIPID
ncbi:hypothetical protein APHAL10511_003766 [Amanita phalloides]|nr:hypothetical protein APHAL10511_003766 [Amanita phalloides]